MQLLGYVKDPATNANWKILDETSTINGINSQKAQAVSNGVTVTACFSKDIPIQDGPLSFFGLPGLITKLSTSDGWEAEFKGLKNNKDPKKQIEVVDYALISETDIKKAIENANSSRGIRSLPQGIKVEKRN